MRRELTGCLWMGRTLLKPRPRVGLRGKNFVSSDIRISQRPAEADAHDNGPACVAMAASPPGLDVSPLIPGSRHTQWWLPQEGDDRGARPQAAGRTLEIREVRRRHRRGRHEDCLTISVTNF